MANIRKAMFSGKFTIDYNAIGKNEGGE